MKILFSLTYYFPYVSGLTLYAQRVAEGLTERGHRIEVLTSQHLKSLPKEEKIDKVSVTRIPYLLKFSKGFLMPGWLVSGYKKVRENDIIICNYPQVEGLWLIALGKILRKKTILVYQCDVVLPSGIQNRIVEGLLYLLNYLSCYLADTIINTSEDYSHNSPLLSKFLKKINFVFPPIKDLSQGNNKISSNEKSSLESMEKFGKKIGFVGRISAEKGINLLLESVSFLETTYHNFGIFLVGPMDAVGEKEYLEKTRLLVEKYKNKVFLFGRLSDSALSLYYKTIDVLVLPSTNSTEAFGMVQVEAMLAGVPVVVSDLPGVRVPVKETGMGEIFPVGDLKEMVATIIKVLDNKKRYFKNKIDINKIFSTKKTLDSYEKIIKNFIKEK